MGYCMWLQSYNFAIKDENKPKALAAIKELAGQEQRGGGRVSRVGKTASYHFSWVTTANFIAAETLEDAMRAWRWRLERFSRNEDKYEIEFMGEKSGDDDILFNAIAPFMEPGSFIEMIGEDQKVWRWYFDGKKCHEQDADVVYNYPKTD
jgi:hypothetical protein